MIKICHENVLLKGMINHICLFPIYVATSDMLAFYISLLLQKNTFHPNIGELTLQKFTPTDSKCGLEGD